jgi:hypothetical protein
MQNIFNRTNITLALAGAFALVSLAAAVACDPSSGSGAASATPVKQPATQVIEVQPTPNATQVANLPAATPKPAAAAPHVVWMAETHAGANRDDVADSHSLALVFPDATHDYYVVLVGPSPDGITEFCQFDVTGASLKAS